MKTELAKRSIVGAISCHDCGYATAVVLCALGLLLPLNALAQERTPRPDLKYADREVTRVFSACELAVALNLNGLATTGDIEQACRCVDRAFEASTVDIPVKYRTKYIWNRPEGEVINVYGIKSQRRADLIPGAVQVAAGRLAWAVIECLGPLPTRSQLIGEFARDWSNKPHRRYDYLGPITTPEPGDARPLDKDLGGLLSETIQYVHHVIMDSYLRRSSDEGALDARYENLRWLDAYDSNARNRVVISCEYRTQADNGYNRWMSTWAYFFWYAPEETDGAEAIVAGSPPDHPIRTIGPSRTHCPLREPAK